MLYCYALPLATFAIICRQPRLAASRARSISLMIRFLIFYGRVVWYYFHLSVAGWRWRGCRCFFLRAASPQRCLSLPLYSRYRARLPPAMLANAPLAQRTVNTLYYCFISFDGYDGDFFLALPSRADISPRPRVQVASTAFTDTRRRIFRQLSSRLRAAFALPRRVDFIHAISLYPASRL